MVSSTNSYVNNIEKRKRPKLTVKDRKERKHQSIYDGDGIQDKDTKRNILYSGVVDCYGRIMH